MNESARDKLMDVTGAMSTQISGDALMSLAPGDENTSTYLAMVEQMRDMRSNSADIINMYAMKLASDNVSFIVDDAEDGRPPSARNIRHPEMAQIKEALTTPSASPTFYSDEFGTYMSGYAPIKDANGTTVAILGVDVTAVATLQQIDNVRNSTVDHHRLLGGHRDGHDPAVLPHPDPGHQEDEPGGGEDQHRRHDRQHRHQEKGRGRGAGRLVRPHDRLPEDRDDDAGRGRAGQKGSGSRRRNRKSEVVHLSVCSEEAIKVTQRYLGPAAKTFLERQTRSHMNGLDLNNLEKAHLPELAKWVETSAGLLIDKPKAKELAEHLAKIRPSNDRPRTGHGPVLLSSSTSLFALVMFVDNH